MEKTLKLVLIALVMSIIFLQGCAQTNPPSPNPLNDTGATQQGVNSVVDANNKFALELYSQYASQDGNIFFSPSSISTAFAMTYEGARGGTAEEMQSVFHFPADNNTRRSAFAKIYNEINSKNNEYNLSTANALWAQKDYKFLDTYFNVVQTYYGGNVTNLDFAGDTENSRVTINNWVAEQTNDKIKDLLPQGSISSFTRLVLTNAIYFKGNWAAQFNPSNTDEEDFKLSTNNTVKVHMMHLDSDKEFNYTETNDAQILELPYQGNELSMLILLPKEDNLQTLEQSLTAENLSNWRAMLRERQVIISLPKFQFEKQYSMVGTLQNMGMKKAFDPAEADFSGMDGTRNLYITGVIHKAFINVDEQGTEAAAATAVVVSLTAVEKPVFTADHPFIFIIQQKDTGNILFMGRVSNPSE